MASTFLVGGASAAQAAAGFVALEGSDATALHHDSSYTPQLFKYLQGSSSLPVLILGGDALTGITGGVSTVAVGSLAGVDLSLYSALYVESPGGCCTANPSAIDGFGASVNAFIAAGGNFSVENYVGGGYDGVVPGGAGQSRSFGTTTIYGTTCTDGEVVNANGIAKGFTQPPVDHCWSHQGYQGSYWLPLGYISLMDSDPSFTYGDGSHFGSSLLAFGGSLGTPTDVPEPLTLSLFSAGLVGAFSMRRKAKKA